MAPTSLWLAAVLAWLSRPPEHVGGPEDGRILAPGGLEGGPEDPRGDGRVEDQGQDSPDRVLPPGPGGLAGRLQDTRIIQQVLRLGKSIIGKLDKTSKILHFNFPEIIFSSSFQYVNFNPRGRRKMHLV